MLLFTRSAWGDAKFLINLSRSVFDAAVSIWLARTLSHEKAKKTDMNKIDGKTEKNLFNADYFFVKKKRTRPVPFAPSPLGI